MGFMAGPAKPGRMANPFPKWQSTGRSPDAPPQKVRGFGRNWRGSSGRDSWHGVRVSLLRRRRITPSAAAAGNLCAVRPVCWRRGITDERLDRHEGWPHWRRPAVAPDLRFELSSVSMKTIRMILVSIALSVGGLAMAEEAPVSPGGNPPGGNPPLSAPSKPAAKSAKKSKAKPHKRVSKPKSHKGAPAPKSASRKTAPAHRGA